MNRFAIVEFTDEKAVDVVPESWIEKRNKECYCYYPRANVVGCVRKMVLPDKQCWTAYKIRILSFTDKYDKAIKRARKAEETSNVDTSESESEPPNKRLRSDVNYAESDDQDFNLENRDPNTKLADTKQQARTKKTCLPKAAGLPPKHRISNSLSLPSPPDFSGKNSASLKKTTSVSKGQSQFEQSTSRSPSVARSAEIIGESLRALHSHPNHFQIPESQEPFQFTACSDPEDSFTGIFQDLSGQLRELDNENQWNSTVNRSPGLSDIPYKQHAETNQNFRTSVLVKLDTIIDNQKESLVHLRQQSSRTAATYDVELEDILPKPMDSIDDVEKLCSKLEQTKSNNTLVAYLAAQCGHSCGDTVRRIMVKLGTNKLWSLYSYKGRKGKRSFKSLNLCNAIIKACMKSHQKASELNVEEFISETLKHAPNRPGGSRYQNTGGPTKEATAE